MAGGAMCWLSPDAPPIIRFLSSPVCPRLTDLRQPDRAYRKHRETITLRQVSNGIAMLFAGYANSARFDGSQTTTPDAVSGAAWKAPGRIELPRVGESASGNPQQSQHGDVLIHVRPVDALATTDQPPM